MKKKEKILSIVFVILGIFMLCDAILMFCNSEYQSITKDIILGIGFVLIGCVYLSSSRED